MRTVWLLIMVTWVCVSCAPPRPAQLPTSTPSPRETRADLPPRLEDLVGRMPDRYHFAPEDVDRDENLPLFIELAASSSEPALRLAALRAMRDAYPAHAVDAYTLAVADNLRSDDPRLVHAAMEASSPSLGREARPEVRRELLRLVRAQQAPLRVAALDAIWQAEPFPTSVFVEALTDADPVVRGMALLHVVQQKVRDHVFFEPARKLMGDPDPGVRGKAVDLAVLTARPEERETVGTSLARLLADPHPFVRSQAALGLARLGQFEAVPRLMPLLSDKAPNTYQLEYTNLLGEPDRLYFKSSRTTRVDEAVLAALSRLSGGDFRYHEPRTEAEIPRNVRRARAWYVRYYDRD